MLSANGSLTPKERALVALSACVACGCRSEFPGQFEEARAAGACERGLGRALEIGLSVRSTASTLMKQWIDRFLAEANAPAPPPVSYSGQIFAFMAVGAAFAANCGESLALNAATARQLGATRKQLEAVIEVARDVRSASERGIAARAAGMFQEWAQPGDEEMAAVRGCGCPTG